MKILNVIRDVSLDNEVPLNFGRYPGPYPDRLRLGGGHPQHCPSGTVFIFNLDLSNAT